MKPARFEYHAPERLDDAVALLSELGDEAQLLAGGQSLIPLMNMRLARPEHLVDLARIESLSGVSVGPDTVRLGAMVRHRHVERSADIEAANPLLAAAASRIAHFQIRERGTAGGSIAHADPSAELPLVASLLDATMHAQGPNGAREIPARDFFVSVFTTALDEREVLTQVSFPRLVPGEGWAVEEVTRRHGDFAIVATVATVTLEAGRYTGARLAVGGVGPTPVRLREVEMLTGEEPSQGLWDEVAARAAGALTPPGDLHASPQDRLDLSRTLIARSLSVATKRALDGYSR